jgi:hypothetical protein
VIVAGSKGLRYVPLWETVVEDIVSGLDVEGLFNFGVGCEEEVEDD